MHNGDIYYCYVADVLILYLGNSVIRNGDAMTKYEYKTKQMKPAVVIDCNPYFKSMKTFHECVSLGL